MKLFRTGTSRARLRIARNRIVTPAGCREQSNSRGERPRNPLYRNEEPLARMLAWALVIIGISFASAGTLGILRESSQGAVFKKLSLVGISASLITSGIVSVIAGLTHLAKSWLEE